MFNFKHEKVNYHDFIGRGSFGSVYPYRSSSHDDSVVVKCLTTKDFGQVKSFCQEIVIGFNHDHPFIVPTLGYHFEESLPDKSGWKMYIKMPRMKNSLADVLRCRSGSQINYLSKKQVVEYFYCLSNALSYLEDSRIAHRDVKPSNILVDEDGIIHLADLGLGRFLCQGEASYLTLDAGTPKYMAPEWGISKNLKRKELFKADVWSLGMTLLDICAKKIEGIRYDENTNKIEGIIKGRLAEVAESYGEELAALISRLLVINPKNRITFSEICSVLEDNYSTMLEDIFVIIKSRVREREVLCFSRACVNYFKRKMRYHRIREILEDLSDTNSKERIRQDGFSNMFEITLEKDLSIIPFDPSSIVDTSLQKLITELDHQLKSNSISQIKSFDLDLSWCSDITDKGIKHLTFDHYKLEGLEELSLNFSGCSVITDKGILQLCSSTFVELRRMKRLSLDFSGCDKITENGVKKVIKTVGRTLEGLQATHFNFCECNNIIFTEKTIENLCFQLTQKKLDRVILDFARCQNITNQAKNTLRSYLQDVKQLKVY